MILRAFILVVHFAVGRISNPSQAQCSRTDWKSVLQRILLFTALTSGAVAEDPPVKMATIARLDLMGVDSVGELRDGRLVRGDGDVDRMHWIAASDQPRSLSATFTISPLGWREFTLRFIPKNTGAVALNLMGPFEQSEGQVLKQEVLWDALSAEGATLANGGFEKLTGTVPSDWENHGGVAVTASPRLPAAEGRFMAKTWHNRRLTTTLQVTAGQPVVVHGHARSLVPEGFVEMQRVESRDTPAHRAARRFQRGVNLGNNLEAPLGEDWGARYGAEDFAQIRAEGFDHVRLPVGWQHYTGPTPDFILGQGIFAKVDAFVDQATKQGLNVIVNVHHYDQFTSQPVRERAKFLAIWRQIAEHYATAKENVVFELLNEPKDAATSEVLNEIYPVTIQEIRRTNPDRTIFVGPAQWNSANELPNLRLPDNDLNLIATVHCYSPMYFTHQGAPWTGPDFAITGVRFPGPPEKPLTPQATARVKPYVLDWIHRYNTLTADENPSGTRSFADYLLSAQEWSEYYGRPVHVGEFGCIVRADAASRANYCRAVREQLERAGIGWALWDWKAGFRYWDTAARQPMPGLHEALFEKIESKKSPEKSP